MHAARREAVAVAGNRGRLIRRYAISDLSQSEHKHLSRIVSFPLVVSAFFQALSGDNALAFDYWFMLEIPFVKKYIFKNG